MRGGKKKKLAKKAAAEVERLQAELAKAQAAAGKGDSGKGKKGKGKKKKGRKKLLVLLIVGGALAASEDLRGKVLDALFGAEEEFQYTPPAPAGEGPAAA